MKKYCVSLKLAKEMKELGFEQKSIFYWATYDSERKYWNLVRDNDPTLSVAAEKISTYTVGELGEILPQIIEINKIKYQLFISVGLDKQWFVVYADEKDYHNNAPFKIMMCKSEANARAKMLIFLKSATVKDSI